MRRFILKFFIYSFAVKLTICYAQIPDKRMCVDPECKSPISEAKTMLAYSSPSIYQLSFKANQHVVIYSKSAGSNINLWGAEINGKRGYVPMKMVQETKILGKPNFLVETEISNDSTIPKVPRKDETVAPSKVKANYEVIDGTTIYIQPEHHEKLSSPEDKLESSAESTDTNATDIPSSADNQIYHKDYVNADEETSNLKITNSKVNAEENIENSIEKSGSDDMGFLTRMLDNVMDNVKGMLLDEEHESTSNENIKSDSGFKTSRDQSEISKEKDEISNMNIKEVNQEETDNSSNQKQAIQDKTEELSGDNMKIEKEYNLSATENNASTETEEKESILVQNISLDGIDLEVKKGLKEEKFQSDSVLQNEPLLDDGKNNKFNDSSMDDLPVNLEPQFEVINDYSNQKSLPVESVEAEKLLEKQIPPGIRRNEEKIVVIEQDSKDDLHAEKLNEGIVKNDNEIPNEKLSKEQDSLSLNNSIDTDALPTIDFNLTELQQKKLKSEDGFLKRNIETVSDTFSENQEIVDLHSNNETDQLEPVIEPLHSKGTDQKEENNIKERLAQNDLETETITESITFKDHGVNHDNSQITDKHDKNSSEKPLDSEVGDKESANLVQSNKETTSPEFSFAPILRVNSDNINQSDIKGNYEDQLVEDPVQIIPTPPPKENGDGNILKENDIGKNLDATEKKTGDYDHTTQEQFNTKTEIHDKPQENDIDSAEKLDKNLKIPEETVNIYKYLDSNGPDDFKDANNQKYQDSGILENPIGEIQSENVGIDDEYCTKEECPGQPKSRILDVLLIPMGLPNFGSDLFLYLATTATFVIIFLLGHFVLDKSRREGPLVARMNDLEKKYLILLKENQLLSDQVENNTQHDDYVESQDFLNLQQEKQDLEEQVQTLEKELENSTEVGLELNRMLSEILNSDNAGETLMLNIENLQAQLLEQQGIVSSMKQMLNLKETENHELHLELDISSKRAIELQSELDKLLLNIMRIEEEKDLLEKNYESTIIQLKGDINILNDKLKKLEEDYSKKIDALSNELCTSNRNLQLKTKEFNGLKDSMKELKTIKNGNKFESILEVNTLKAELEQFKTDYQSQYEELKREKENNSILEKRAHISEMEVQTMKGQFDEVDKAKLELETKLQVLTNYFKEKEEHLQKELAKYETMWSAKQGEATSTSERIKYLQSEVQNYKAQNETLRQEILSQEVELKSQISVLEKKVHENWVGARQAERRLEDMKQEAAQLRNRLTLRERALQEDSARKRMQSPLDQSAELPVSPLHLESPSSPPLLFNSREHITKSPPMLGMPPPFLPPPPGVPFLPPPHLPFMPPPSDMFPGDHRPPPLGRMSSPPLNSRYSPDRRAYSPYERRSPSPSYDESEYGTSPVHHRRYSPFSGRRDHRRMAPPVGKMNGRGGAMSSGSGNSNESLDR